jgi:glycosyltransferase involved in cell wall biosynthesis
LGSFLQQKKETSYYQGNKITLDQLTVLVPYRNEEQNLGNFIDCLEKSTALPEQVIFIDDHSTDNSTNLIKQRLKDKYLLLKLDESIGKKEALREGIFQSKNSFILTMDADVVFDSKYFESLMQLEEADLYLFPVVLKGKKFLQVFFELDLLMVNALNSSLHGWHRPIIASGANLLFRKETYLKVNQYETHKHVMSGDDIYLLRDFRKAKADIRLVLNKNLTVYSYTPDNLIDFFHQRLRWIAKTGNVRDHLSTFIGVFQALMILTFCWMTIFFIQREEYHNVCVLFTFKSLIDLLGFFPYFKKFNAFKQLAMLAPYQLIYPIYLLIISVLLPFFKPVWKNRIATVYGRSG